MKIALCLFNYFPFGGLQRDFLRIAKECVKRGHRIHVYTMKWDGPLEDNIPVTIIPTTGLQNHQRCRNFVKQLHNELKMERYDCVVGFNKMPGLDIYYAADTCYQSKMYEQRAWWHRLTPRYRHLVSYEKAVFHPRNNTKILLISPKQQKDFQQCYQTMQQRFRLLPPGIAKDRIAPANAAEIRQAVRQQWQLAENQFLLLFVGSGFRTKGLDRLIKGVAALPLELQQRTTVLIVGQDRPNHFKRQAKKLGIESRLAFLGGRSDVPELLLAADLLVHPAYNENTGTVILEALVAGLPVLTTDVCGYADYVNQAQAGIVLSSPFQQREFNNVLTGLLSLPNRIHLRQKALAFAENADIYSLSEKAVDAFETMRGNR